MFNCVMFSWKFGQLCHCQLTSCSTGFLVNYILFNSNLFKWIFVQKFCSKRLVQKELGELTWKEDHYPVISNYISHLKRSFKRIFPYKKIFQKIFPSNVSIGFFRDDIFCDFLTDRIVWRIVCDWKTWLCMGNR